MLNINLSKKQLRHGDTLNINLSKKLLEKYNEDTLTDLLMDAAIEFGYDVITTTESDKPNRGESHLVLALAIGEWELKTL